MSTTICTPEPQFSLFAKCYATTPADNLTLSEFMAGIKDGKWKSEVESCRLAPKEGGKSEYNKLRKKLVPAATFSVKLKSREKGSLEEQEAVHSGLLQLDFDAKDHPGLSVEVIRQIVCKAPFVAACFASLSGDGVKAIARCPASFETHLGSWLAADEYFKAQGLTLDASTKDETRLSFVSYDRQAFHWDEAEEIAPLPVPKKTAAIGSSGSSGGTEDPEHVRGVLAKLVEKIGLFQDRNTWIHIVGCTADAVGADAAGEIVDEHFPLRNPESQSASEVAHTLEGTWNTLFKYGIDPRDPRRREMPVESEGDEQSAKLSLRERAYALRFDPSEPPPPDELCMVIGDFPIAARGNLTVIQGKSKVGKSAVVSAILGAVHRGDGEATGDTLCVSWAGESTGAIIHLDTEQSRADWHALVSRGITRSGLPEVSARLVSFPLVMFARSERMEILSLALEHEHREKGGVDAVVIDGVADLCKSPNDETEANELVSQIHALSQKFTCPIYCILHENPSTEQGKTRGHLGSELNRKAFANIRIDKDSEAVSTIYGTEMRKREIPKAQGFCFAWDDALRMHAFKGRAAGLKAVETNEKAVKKARTKWQGIFESIEIGTNGECPELTPEQAAEAEQDITGTEKPVKVDTMKKRMQRAEDLGVLRKTGAGAWTLNPPGQSGQIRDI